MAENVRDAHRKLAGYLPTKCFGRVLVYAGLLLIGFAVGVITSAALDAPEPAGLQSVPETRTHSARFIPLPPPDPQDRDQTEVLPSVDVIDVEGVRSLAGHRARVRGKVYRVGHSAKSNTYFLDFGPSHSSFTAVIFASAIDAFKHENREPRSYESKEVEIVGTIEDDPRYGLEMIIESPSQIREFE